MTPSTPAQYTHWSYEASPPLVWLNSIASILCTLPMILIPSKVTYSIGSSQYPCDETLGILLLQWREMRLGEKVSQLRALSLRVQNPQAWLKHDTLLHHVSMPENMEEPMTSSPSPGVTSSPWNEGKLNTRKDRAKTFLLILHKAGAQKTTAAFLRYPRPQTWAPVPTADWGKAAGVQWQRGLWMRNSQASSWPQLSMRSKQAFPSGSITFPNYKVRCKGLPIARRT